MYIEELYPFDFYINCQRSKQQKYTCRETKVKSGTILKQTPNATRILVYVFLFLYVSKYFSLITLYDNN